MAHVVMNNIKCMTKCRPLSFLLGWTSKTSFKFSSAVLSFIANIPPLRSAMFVVKTATPKI